MKPVISDMMRVALTQYALVAVVAALFAVFAGQNAAVSALLGGSAHNVVCVVAEACSTTHQSRLHQCDGCAARRVRKNFGCPVADAAERQNLRKLKLARFSCFIDSGSEQLFRNAVQKTLRIGIHGNQRPERY